MEQVKGIPTTICLTNGKVLKNVKAGGPDRPVYDNIYLLDGPTAEHLFLTEKPVNAPQKLTFRKVKDAGALRSIQIGKAKVAEAPNDEDFEQAAVYEIDVPSASADRLMSISYRGDCARLYADGKLIADNFYYGRPFYYGLWRLPADVTKLELRVLPLQENAPVYLPEEADKTPGESVNEINSYKR